MEPPSTDAISSIVRGQLLRIGQTACTESACRLTKFLGGGGEDELYGAQWSGASYALKWCFGSAATEPRTSTIPRLQRPRLMRQESAGKATSAALRVRGGVVLAV